MAHLSNKRQGTFLTRGEKESRHLMQFNRAKGGEMEMETEVEGSLVQWGGGSLMGACFTLQR